MEYVVPLLIVLVIVLVVVVGVRLVGRRGQAQADQRHGDSGHGGAPGRPVDPGRRLARAEREINRENAEAASARLTPESHRVVYSMIAQNQVLNAVKEYRKATRMGLGDSAAAVAALAQFPQPAPDVAKAVTVEPGVEPVVDPAVEPMPVIKDGPLTVEDIMNAGTGTGEETSVPAPTHSTYRYRAIVSQGSDIREVASTRLNEEIFGTIRDLAKVGNFDGAARLLREHADIGETEAREFVAMIGPED